MMNLQDPGLQVVVHSAQGDTLSLVRFRSGN